MNWSSIPNLLSLLRVLIAPFLFWAIISGASSYALILCLIAGVSDALDGFLAKRFAWNTHIGSVLDPLADKAILIFAYLGLVISGEIPAWLFVVVAARDVLIVAGGIAFYRLIGEFEMRPSVISKINTFIQIFFVILVISIPLFPAVSLLQEVYQVLIYVVLSATVLSGLDYVWEWGLRAWRVFRYQG